MEFRLFCTDACPPIGDEVGGKRQLLECDAASSVAWFALAQETTHKQGLLEADRGAVASGSRI